MGKKDLEKKKAAKEIQEKLQKKIFLVKKLSTENKELYGSVKPTEISRVILEREKIEITPSQIQPIKEIKSIGNFKVNINLHSEVVTSITINVVPEEDSK